MSEHLFYEAGGIDNINLDTSVVSAEQPDELATPQIGLEAESPAADSRDADASFDELPDSNSEGVADENSVPSKVADPGALIIRSGVRRRRRANKETLKKRRNEFRAGRKQAEREEVASVTEEVLQTKYRTVIDQERRIPDEDDLLRGFNFGRTARRARQIIGDMSKLRKSVEEDIAWEAYEAEISNSKNKATEIGVDVLPHDEVLMAPMTEKMPAEWNRNDVITIYCGVSKQAGHWLSAGELRELCRRGAIPSKYQTVVRMFGSVDELFAEAQQAATWFQAKQERDRGEEAVAESPQPQAIVDGVEKSKEVDRGELYQAIAEGRQLAKPDQASKGAKITISVLGDNVIRVDDKDIVLEDHKLFAFNALLLTRYPATATELRSLGFDPQASGTDFARAMTSLGNALKRAVGFDLIGKLSKGRQSLFVLNPNVVVSDGRRIKMMLTVKDKKAAEPVSERVVASDNVDTEYDEDAEFESNSERDQAIITILNRYRLHPRVLKKVNEFKIKEIPIGGASSEVQQYFNFAEQFSLLDEAEEKALFSFIEAGLSIYQALPDLNYPSPREEDALINLAIAHRVVHLSNLRLVASIAMPHAPRNMLPLMDLIQEGNLGLYKAIGRFDYALGYKFSTYATWWIRQSIERAMADKGRLVRMPVHAHEGWLKIERNAKALAHTLEREPTEAELAKFSGLPVDKVRLYRRAGPPQLVSLDWKVGGDDDDTTLGELLPDKRVSMDKVADQLSAKIEIVKLFASSRLMDREKLILGLRHGAYDSLSDDLHVERPKTRRKVNYQRHIGKIATTQGMTLDAIGYVLGISHERVRQIERDALLKSRLIIEDFRNQQD